MRNNRSFLSTATAIDIRWNSTGTTVAGFTLGGGNSATQFATPYSLAVGPSNTIYVADRFNHRIQRWLSGAPSGVTVAGQSNGIFGSGLSFLHEPNEVILNSNGDLYIADTENHRVVYWTVNATTGTLVAGTGNYQKSIQYQMRRPSNFTID